ncbi:MAG: hypothetical protein BGN86_05930 [Caulobacterales bacterium 68-7]|nr:hypothetical protein [Caulobacterales bacterium]OJU13125.1 MAG: hypothetical protein BGN86_05930 [Caulobacterales bacterium 68-7]
MADDKVEVLNVNHPGKSTRQDRRKYEAACKALLDGLPSEKPGLLQAEMVEAVRSRLPDDLFPGGATAGWWTKCVQLDQEARGTVVRYGKPVRWIKA